MRIVPFSVHDSICTFVVCGSFIPEPARIFASTRVQPSPITSWFDPIQHPSHDRYWSCTNLPNLDQFSSAGLGGFTFHEHRDLFHALVDGLCVTIVGFAFGFR